jgi:hypothetical protein
MGMKMNKLSLLICILFIPILFSLTLNVSAIQVLMKLNSSLEVQSIVPFEYNSFYQNKLYSGGGSSTGISINLHDSNGNIIDTRELSRLGEVSFNIDDISSRYSITSGILYRSAGNSFSLCNNNGVCEPCNSFGCIVAESYASCSDCVSGSEDGFCDLKEDEKCDIDCNNLDSDCECGELCFQEIVETKLTNCRSLGGRECAFNQICDGNYIYADDTGNKCCKGTCIDKTPENDLRIWRDVRYKKLEEEAEDEIIEEIRDEEELFVKSYSNEDLYQDEDVDNSNIFLILALVLSLICIIVGMSYFVHKEHAEHFNNPIVRYVDGLFKQGYTKEQILPYMQQHGYKQDDVQGVFKLLKK